MNWAIFHGLSWPTWECTGVISSSASRCSPSASRRCALTRIWRFPAKMSTTPETAIHAPGSSWEAM